MLAEDAFGYTGLKYFEFVESITKIDQRAFEEVGRYGGGGLINRQLDVMPNLTTIATNAFNHAFAPVYLPGSVTTIGQNAFRYNGLLQEDANHGITGFVIGSSGHPSQLGTKGGSLGINAFTSAGAQDYAITVYTDDETKSIWTELAAQVGGAINLVSA